MKHTYFTRMVIPVIGIAFGFFIGTGCSTLAPQNSTETERTAADRDLQKRLARIDSQIADNPENAEAYFQKGEVLSSLAQRQTPPEKRADYYRQMQQALAEAGILHQNEGNPQGKETVDELLQVSWSFEHNQGVEILQTDSTLSSTDFNTAAAHFNNAIIIIPDSAISYRMKARALYRDHQTGQAIQTLEAARRQIDRLPGSYLEQLAYLYLENSQHQQAVELYEEAEAFSDDNLNLLHGLANAYITSNRHRSAAQLLARLVENEPENIIYLESYGTELYKLAMQQLDSLRSRDIQDSQAIQQVKARSDTLMQRAQNQFKKTLQLDPENPEFKQQLAHSYKNYAAKLSQVQPLFPEEYQETISDQIESNLTNAVTLYEELVEQQPDQAGFWESLYQAYSYLGMEDQANEAKVKANL
ncbi:tetratricopeptide repeat protein [Halalkalibaculum sp. DA3122]|uniref:tetratricopeptide repeat protein n=1 Tax=Halalkalibaculum sp. DA3122 TaxID=3373607 RepID=UPI00375410D2